MPGRTHTLDAWVLGKRPPSDTFQTFTIFGAAEGSVLALQRLSRKPNAATALDLFDEASLVLEEPLQGEASFIKEARLLARHQGIGRSYESLQLASRFAGLVARNPVAAESRPLVYRLLGQAFHAFGTSDRPEIVYLKSLYRFCRDEGYPLKQAWAPTLSATDRAALVGLLNQPLSEQTAEPKVVERLQRRLEDYLRAETEILLE